MTITAVVVLVCLVLIVSSDDYRAMTLDDSHDTLAYVTRDGRLSLYDPVTHTETLLLTDVEYFSLSPAGRVAYKSLSDNSLYVYDPSRPNHESLRINPDVDVSFKPLAWSPDGQYLAFSSYEDREQINLFVWDGDTVSNITPEDLLGTVRRFFVDWSYDGRLAFTIRYDRGNIPYEIYLWHGNDTVSLSQNPDESDSMASWYSTGWSNSGQFMFLSQQDDIWQLYIWDGESVSNGSPDADTFTHILLNIEFNIMSFNPVWVDDFTVGISLGYPPDSEIVLWDTELNTVTERLPLAQASSWLDKDNEVIIYSGLASGLPSIFLDVTTLDGEILFSDVVMNFLWSSRGYLAYCGFDEDRNTILFVWDGQESRVVSQDYRISVQWQSDPDQFGC
ncbi:MAG: hypothetical protein AAF846_17420 [Chloroflexota bacterium]